MRVLQLGKFYPPDLGGIETVTADLVTGLRQRGIRTDVLCFNKARRTVVERTPLTKVIRCASLFTVQSMPISLSLFSWLVRILKDYDVVHVHLPNPLVCFYLFFLPTKAKFVLHWHSDIVKQRAFRLLYAPFVRALILRSSTVLAPTIAHVADSEFAGLLKPKAVEVAYSINLKALSSRGEGVRPPALGPEWTGGRMVFALGRLVPYKGFTFLIEAMQQLTPDVRLVIGGEGPLRSRLERQVVEAGLASRVSLVGRLSFDEIIYLYQKCTVFCLPSIWKSEMFGLVQAEAMVFGKPVVSTRIPGSGVPLVNQHGRTGITVAPEDASALALGLRQALEDQALQERCRQDSLGYVRERFGMDAVVDRILALYDVLARPNRP